MRGLPQDLIDFKDQVTLLLNNGRYSNIVVSSVPTWNARNGEAVFYLDSANNVRRWYYYLNNAWNKVEVQSEVVKGWVLMSSLNLSESFHKDFKTLSFNFDISFLSYFVFSNQ